MLAGFLPIVAACVITYVLIESGTELVLLIPSVCVIAYLFALAIFGIGWLWADKVHRRSGKTIPKLTFKMVQIMTAILILPFVVLPVLGCFYAK
jgi:hypothetical protein